MTHHEKLVERYEDALFALMMEDVAETEGEKLQELNEQLKRDPSAEIPRELDERCIRTIRTEFGKKNFISARRGAVRVFRVISAATLIMMLEERRKYANAKTGDDVLFADFMEQWLEIVKSTVSIPTYSSYVNAVKSIIAPYFRKKKILLRDLQAHDIQMFYQEQLQRVKASSVIHYHANIHKALKYAVKNDMIPSNPADKVERPKQDKFYGNFYDRDELNKLFEAVAGTKLELPVLLGAFYGLRRSEIVGLKWSAIDFEQNTITISHTVTSCNLDGKCVIVAKDTTKTKSSRRTLPLVPYFHEKLLAVKAQQERNQKLCGRSYNREFLEYICVDDIGDRFKPNYITSQFPKLLERNGFRKIRFHDLRHSCASLLLASGVPMKHIQEWLGHSDFSTTANIYAHLDYSSKLTSASAMESNFHLGV